MQERAGASSRVQIILGQNQEKQRWHNSGVGTRNNEDRTIEMWSSGSDKVVLTWIDADVGHFSEMTFSRDYFTFWTVYWFVFNLVPSCEARRVLSWCIPNVSIIL